MLALLMIGFCHNHRRISVAENTGLLSRSALRRLSRYRFGAIVAS
jgi:hypothetical protein